MCIRGLRGLFGRLAKLALILLLSPGRSSRCFNISFIVASRGIKRQNVRQLSGFWMLGDLFVSRVTSELLTLEYIFVPSSSLSPLAARASFSSWLPALT